MFDLSFQIHQDYYIYLSTKMTAMSELESHSLFSHHRAFRFILYSQLSFRMTALFFSLFLMYLGGLCLESLRNQTQYPSRKRSPCTYRFPPLISSSPARMWPVLASTDAEYQWILKCD